MEVLKRNRVERVGITQGSMADRLGVSLHTIKSWESGKRLIKLSDLSRVSKAYILSINDLLEYIDKCSSL